MRQDVECFVSPFVIHEATRGDDEYARKRLEAIADFYGLREIVEEINGGLPKDTWDDVPTDGSINLDHCLYGAPKQQP